MQPLKKQKKRAKARKIKLLLVDDHPIVLEGIKSHLSAQEEFAVVGDAGTGQEAIAKTEGFFHSIGMPTRFGPYQIAAEEAAERVETRLKERGLFDPVEVRRIIDSNLAGHEDLNLQVFQLLTLELWMQAFLDDSHGLGAAGSK